MIKYADIESVRVLSDQEQTRINTALRKSGKVTLLDLSEEERTKVLKPSA
jgi:hypothetical protein